MCAYVKQIDHNTVTIMEKFTKFVIIDQISAM